MLMDWKMELQKEVDKMVKRREEWVGFPTSLTTRNFQLHMMHWDLNSVGRGESETTSNLTQLSCMLKPQKFKSFNEYTHC